MVVPGYGTRVPRITFGGLDIAYDGDVLELCCGVGHIGLVVADRAGSGRFALVIADPPYGPSGETGRFEADPDHAIDGGDDGLAVARACVATARRVLLDGCPLVMQTGGPDQAAAIAAEHPDAVAEIRTFAPDRAVLRLDPETP